MKKIIFILMSFLLLTTDLWSQNKAESQEHHWIIPDYAKVQFAGNIGYFSGGFAYQLFKKKLQTEFIYGYVPKKFAHTEIHTLNLKNTFPLLRKQYLGLEFTPYLGFTFSYETGRNSFVELPCQYPSGYYSPNAFHLCFLAGVSAKKNLNPKYFIKGIECYAEVVSVDSFFWYKLNSRQIKLYQVVSLALGVNFYF
ncbi:MULTISPECIES: hypothetical protein [unclassified Lentimicrobium]|uniref:hypothetical protein n=1 Tax=unclassified Lentimicrobium TaxID=2677434 RepID=UPI00155617D0|nr:MULTISPECIES: hypothetical protein [unclassified Lentimicrobium]NPD46309.1 hypothetical protein [Lentimicrobium sp. S6]NPD85299.1 hypothetical protein [Lentimicrobium sp. L6]